jgi:hypothetical protein
LILNASQGKKLVNNLSVLALALVAAAILLTVLSGFLPVSWMILLPLFGFLNALAFVFVRSIPRLLPIVDELYRIVNEIERSGFRFAILKAAFKLLDLIFCALLLLLGTLALFAETVLGALASGTLPVNATTLSAFLPLILAQSILFVLVVRLALDCHQALTGSVASATAQNELAKVKQQLHHVSPAKAFAHALGNPDYEDTLSNIVAVYGIETLWLLS